MKIRLANSVDQDDMVHYKPSHMDLHCLQMFMFWDMGLKELISNHNTTFCGEIRKLFIRIPSTLLTEF